MSYQFNTTVQTRQTKGQHNQDLVAFEPENDFDPMLLKDHPLLGTIPDPLSDLYWRESSNDRRKELLDKMQDQVEQSGGTSPITEKMVHPSVAYIDLTNESTDWSELILGAPDPDLTDEERADQTEEILEDLKTHVAHVMDDGVEYEAAPANGQQPAPQKTGSLTEQPVDTVLGDEISEIDTMMDEDQLRQRLLGRYKMAEEDLVDMNQQDLQGLLRSKVLMDFSLSQSEGIDIAQLQQEFSSGTVLVNIPSGNATRPVDGPTSTSDRHLMAGQIEETTLEPVAALQLAHLATQSHESRAHREVMEGYHKDYVEGEHARIKAGGVSDIFAHGLAAEDRPTRSIGEGAKD